MVLNNYNNTTTGNSDDDMVIDIINETCTCGKWQEYQYLCIHAMGWLRNYRRMDMETIVEEFVSRFYKNETQIEITKQNINPIIFSNLVKDSFVLPPRSTRTNTTQQDDQEQNKYEIVWCIQKKEKEKLHIAPNVGRRDITQVLVMYKKRRNKAMEKMK